MPTPSARSAGAISHAAWRLGRDLGVPLVIWFRWEADINTLDLTAENPDQLIAGFGAGARINVQTSATETGTFVDLTTIDLVAATRAYTYEHLAGISSTWYRIRYEDSAGANANDWSDPFQTGDETSGLLCSLFDVKQRIMGTATVSTFEDELLLEIIREVSDDIEDYVGQWLAPRPTDPGSTMTLMFDVPGDYLWYYPRKGVLLEQSGKRTGIRSFSAVGVASVSQPDTGGTYTALSAADLVIRPRPTLTDPGLRLEYLARGFGGFFYAGQNTVQVTGSFGPASVPPRIQSVALAMVTRRYMGKETAAAAVAVGPDGGVRLLSDIPPGMRDTLDRLRVPNVA